MTTVLKILHTAANLLSGWLVMRAMSYLIEISGKRFRRFLLFFGCYLLCSMIMFIGDPINILGTALVFLVIVLLTCEGSFWKKITIGMMFSGTVFSFNALRDNYIHDFLFSTGESGITVLLFGDSDICNLISEIFVPSEHDYFISCTLILPFALILYLCTRKIAPDKDYTLSDSMWRLLFLLTITPLGIVLTVVTLFRPVNAYFDIFVHREYAVLLLIALFAIVSLLWCVTVLAKQQKLEQQSMFAEINRKYYEAMEQQHFEVRKLKHDLANHMQILTALPEEKRAAYAAELSGNTALSQSFVYCGDSTVNAVLTVKKSVMERCHIRLKTEVDIAAPLPYDKTDLCALYANALDNAIEACMKLPETQREISLKSKVGKGLLCLEIRNPDPDVKKRKSAGPLFPTSKADKGNHGFGLQSIRDIVKRNGGNMEVETKDGVFELFVILSLPSESHPQSEQFSLR